MDTFFQIILRCLFLVLGFFFFLLLLFVSGVMLIAWGLRSLWNRLLGKEPQTYRSASFNPKDGFAYFYTRSSGRPGGAPEPSGRSLEDVTDVEIKEIVRNPDEEGTK